MSYVEILKKVVGVSFITSMIAFSTNFLMSIFSSKDDFASYTIYVSLIGLFINIVPFGLCMLLTVSRYTTQRADYFNYMMTGFLFVAPLVLSLILISIPVIDGLILTNLTSENYATILFITYFNTINLAVISYLRVSQYFRKYSYFFIIYTFNNTMLIFLATVIFKSFDTALHISLLSSTILAFFSIYLGLKLQKSDFEFIEPFNLKRIIGMIKYGFPIVLSTTAMSFLVLGDKLIFGSLNGSQFPTYAVASLIASTSLFLVNNFASSWGAYLSKKLAEKSALQRKLFCTSKLKLLWLVIPLQIVMLSAQLFIYFLFYESKFPNAYSTIVIISCAYSLFGCSKFFMGFINFERKNFFLFISSFLGVLVMFSLPFLSKDVQLNDMATMLLLGMFVQFVFCSIVTKRIYRDY